MERTTRAEMKRSILKNVEAVLDRADEKYETASDAMAGAFDTVKEKTRQAYDTVKEKAVESKENTVNYIKDHPEKSVILAAGVGALVALIVSALVKSRRD